MEHMQLIMVGWKWKVLSSDSKLKLLLESFLGILVYFLSLSKIFGKVRDNIEKISATFLGLKLKKSGLSLVATRRFKNLNHRRSKSMENR